jgi:endoglucanase
MAAPSCVHRELKSAQRLPFGWQYMQPTIGGDLSSSFLQQYDALVQAALSQLNKPYVILDLHNYARLNGAIVGQGGPTNAQFADFWSKLAAKYANQPNVMFGVMNEPHGRLAHL